MSHIICGWRLSFIVMRLIYIWVLCSMFGIAYIFQVQDFNENMFVSHWTSLHSTLILYSHYLHFYLIYKRHKLHIKISQQTVCKTINQRSNCVCVFVVIPCSVLFIHSSNQNNNKTKKNPTSPLLFAPRKWQPWQPT